MSASNNDSKTVARLLGTYTNAELNLAGAGGFTDDDDVIIVSVSLRDLPKLDIIGTIDPYLRISRKKPNSASWEQQFISRAILKNQNPDFPPIALNVNKLTGGDPKQQFLIEVLDRDIASPKDDYVGLIIVSLEQLKTLPVAMNLVKTTGTTYDESPIIIINSIQQVKGKDAPGGATLTAAGAATQGAVDAAKAEVEDAKKRAEEIVAEVKEKNPELVEKAKARLAEAEELANRAGIEVPKEAVMADGGVFAEKNAAAVAYVK